jgi:hypothetical protein
MASSGSPQTPVETSNSVHVASSNVKINLFSKTDKRAKAERESQKRALELRASKGSVALSSHPLFSLADGRMVGF